MDKDLAEKYGLSALDADADGYVTIRDLWDSLLMLIFMPGDAFISLMATYLPAVARFFELGPEDQGTAVARFIAVGVWIAVFVVSGVVISTIRDFDRRLTENVSRLWREALRCIRVCRRRLVTGLASLRRRRRDDGVESAPVVLGSTETAVLKCYAGRDETRMLAPTEVAGMLKLSQQQVNKALRQLLDLRLIERSTSEMSGSPAHRISQAGQIYLIDL